MKNLKDSHPRMALCAGVGAIALLAIPAQDADASNGRLPADGSVQPSVLLAQVPVDPVEGDAGDAPAAETPDPVQKTDELYRKTPDEIIGMDVVDADGETVGKVDDLVMDKAISTVSVVVAVDQILGLVGGKRVVIPLDTLQLHGDGLQIALNKDQIKTSPEYIEEYYVPIPAKDERPISDYLASDAKIG